MYNIGTVTTIANSTKVTGTSTKWKDNNSRVSAEQVILILNDTTAYINSIQSIQSDTELTLSFPAPVAVKNGPYNILTTMVNSVSDAANKIVAMNVANVQFSDIVNRLATETGVIEVVLPDGTKKSMKTFAEMDKQLDGKFDKAGGTVTSHITADGNIQSNAGKVIANLASATGIQLDGTGEIAKIRGRAKDGKWYDHIIPELAGTLMQVGDFGFGGSANTININDEDIELKFKTDVSQLWRTDTINKYAERYAVNLLSRAQDSFANISVSRGGNQLIKVTSGIAAYDPSTWKVSTVYTTLNTTKDSNGNLKAASPIIKVFADHIEVNEESEGIELEKLETGRYKLKGTLGMNSDASWGGIHGGIVIPDGINRLPLIWGDFEVLEDGDIILETRFRDHQLPPPLKSKRLDTYPEFKGLSDYDLCDIPNGHWVDVRVQMPSNSIYNKKKAEAERLAKIEAERLEQEEAKRAAEEAERAEQESIIDENDAL